MAKAKTVFTCQQCGHTAAQWSGQCMGCEQWNTLLASSPSRLSFEGRQTAGIDRGRGARAGFSGEVSRNQPCRLSQVTREHTVRLSTPFQEFDRVLGGGLVPGSVVLLGGDPGVGKSTLLLQALCGLSAHYPVLYTTGEESLGQVADRWHRMQLPEEGVTVLAETEVTSILHTASECKPRVLVVDSIQTVYAEMLSAAPGSVSQVRETALQLVQYAKQTGTVVLLVGHVTKAGHLAGPRVLEHMVDTVLYFEGERGSRWRMVRAVKNRFGAVNELGVFAMSDTGLKEVKHPSALFLKRDHPDMAGSVVIPTWEGTRALLIEIQALVDHSHLGNPRRVAVGLETNRLTMLLAVLHRHGHVSTYDQDVFVNAVGGMRVTDTAADLGIMLAILSSLSLKPLPRDVIVMGEVGLAGEIRPVNAGQDRLHAAVKHGFKRAIVPTSNLPSQPISGLVVYGVTHWADVKAHWDQFSDSVVVTQ